MIILWSQFILGVICYAANANLYTRQITVLLHSQEIQTLCHYKVNDIPKRKESSVSWQKCYRTIITFKERWEEKENNLRRAMRVVTRIVFSLPHTPWDSRNSLARRTLLFGYSLKWESHQQGPENSLLTKKNIFFYFNSIWHSLKYLFPDHKGTWIIAKEHGSMCCLKASKHLNHSERKKN